MRPRLVLLAGAALVLLSACEKREVVPGSQQPADSAAAASETSVAVDSMSDSTRRQLADSAYIGRDSAFGPLFAVDSTGKMVELPVRRP